MHILNLASNANILCGWVSAKQELYKKRHSRSAEDGLKRENNDTKPIMFWVDFGVDRFVMDNRGGVMQNGLGLLGFSAVGDDDNDEEEVESLNSHGMALHGMLQANDNIDFEDTKDSFNLRDK